MGQGEGRARGLVRDCRGLWRPEGAGRTRRPEAAAAPVRRRERKEREAGAGAEWRKAEKGGVLSSLSRVAWR